MKIIKAQSPRKTVEVGTLPVGACWEYTPWEHSSASDRIVGMTVSRNGHTFFLDLMTGKEFNISPYIQVVPVDTTLTYSEKNS